MDFVHAVEHQPRGTAHHDNITGAQFELFCRIAAPQTAVTKTTPVAKRDGDDRRGQIRLVAVLVQAHPRVAIVEIDQAGLGQMRIGGQRHMFSTDKGMAGQALPVNGCVA